MARTVSGHRTVWNKGEPQKHMELAICDIESGVLLVRKAEMYNIPKSTLHDHVSGKVDPGASYSMRNVKSYYHNYLLKFYGRVALTKNGLDVLTRIIL